jgi:predicted HTH domain antitoxin
MLIIDNKVLEWTNLTESQLLEDIAIMLYQKKKLTFGQSAQLANMNYSEFQFLLARNQIPVNYDVPELMEDLETIKELREADGSN